MNLPIKYVNVYLVDRAYGGPQEGGWWFDHGHPEAPEALRGMPLCPVSARTVNVHRARQHAQRCCDEANEDRHSDIGSVISEGRYEVFIEDGPPQAWPQQRPYYE